MTLAPPIRAATKPPRWANRLLIAATLAIFLLQQFRPELTVRWELNAQSPRLFTFISYAFVHIGCTHLLANLIVLAVLGERINRPLGDWAYLGFYLGGAVFAACGYLLVGGHRVLGASGAIGAVMGAHLVLLPRSTIALKLPGRRLELRSGYVLLVFFFYNVVMSLAPRTEPHPVAYQAHVAGMLFGIGLAAALVGIGLAARAAARSK